MIANSSQNKRDLWLLTGIILIGLALRGVMFAVAVSHPERTFQPDSQSYLDPALKLLSNGAYPPDSAYRTPLYPFLIALVYALGGQNSLLVILVQVLLGALVVFLTYCLGVRILPKPAALIGALLISIDLGSITNVFYILTETSFTFLLIAAILAWVEAIQQDKTTWLIISSALMGLSALCRPIALYFPILLAAGLLFIKRRTWLGLLRQLAIYIGVFLVVLLPWVVRNELLIGIPTVTTISNYNLLFYNAASLDANLRHISEIDDRAILQTRLMQVLSERGWADTTANRDRAEESLALQIIGRHPGRYAYLHLKSDLNSLLPNVTELTEIIGLTVGGKGTLSVLNQQGLGAAIRNYFGGNTWLIGVFSPLIVLLGLTYLADLIGGVELTRQRAWFPLAVLIFPIAYFLLIPGAASVPRFRVPVGPYLSLLAGMGVYGIYQWVLARGLKKQSRVS
ncbi:MAG: glycosyltransferase family 39 protein [Anaerolineales bacterium]